MTDQFFVLKYLKLNKDDATSAELKSEKSYFRKFGYLASQIKMAECLVP
jgi:hypothetical protein